ncbi:MAG: anti-phage defense ZorAB system protein ZorA [Veillonellaceae bacterium]|nr:anti-phage defense ZorAB system protein ZorA [Veillonellaceae bacterium]
MSVSTAVTILFCVLDVLLLGVAWKWGVASLLRINRAVRAVYDQLRAISPEAYVQQFEDIEKLFLADAYLAPVWMEYRKTLVRSVEDGEERLFSAIDASAFFRPSEITKTADVSYWQNFGGVFTGVGIFGTFAGLTLGIWGIDLSSGDVTVLKDGIGALLSGISTAFITSLIGIFLALLYGGVYQYYNNRVAKIIALLSSLVEAMYPRRITEQWLSNSFYESKQQTQALKNLSHDMAESLGNILDAQLSSGFDEFCEKLDSQMRPTFEKLYEAIDALRKGGTEAISDEFDRQLGTQLQAFSHVLADVQNAMQNNMQASQRISENMNGRMMQTMESLQEFMRKGTTEILEKQKASAEAAEQRVGETTRLLNETLGQQNQSFEFATQAIKEETIRVGELLTKLQDASRAMHEAAAPIQEAAAGLRDELEAVRAEHGSVRQQLDQLTKNNQVAAKQMQNLMQAMKNASEASDMAWKTYQSNFKGVSGELENTTKLLTDQLSKYNEAMKEGLTSHLKSFDDSVTNATSALGGIADELHETMEELMKYNKR